MRNEVLLSTVLLNWNREDLLRKTLDSFTRTVSVPYELYVLDNASTDGSREIIEKICKDNPRHHAIFLSENLGGDALNVGLEKCQGNFLHISENDLEYLPGWDRELLEKFEYFDSLGQLSLFSPFHQVEGGEIRDDKAAIRETREGKTIYRALTNVGTSCVLRREVWDNGVRWNAHGTKMFWSPDDGRFSRDVKQAGFKVAWNDEYVVVNWGHHVNEIIKRLDYYWNSARGKEVLGLKKMTKRLNDHGYDVIETDEGECLVKQRVPLSESLAAKRSKVWKEWMDQLYVATEKLSAIIPDGSKYILVDDDQFGPEMMSGRRALTFFMTEGQYYGAPENDEKAVGELIKLREQGAKYIVFMWPSFWWLDTYGELNQLLCDHYKCVLRNDRAIVFDLYN